MSSIRVLHLSDLHARAEWEKDQREIADAMITDAERLAGTSPFNLAVVSGDLAFSGQADEYQIAREVLLDPLKTRLGLGPDRVILAPGNHDVDRTKIQKINELGLLQYLQDRERVNSLLDDRDQLAAACERLAGWQAFRDDFYASSAPQNCGALAFTWNLEIADVRVGIAALNSAWRCSGDEDRHRLLLGDRQVKAALDAIDAADVRLVAIHHPRDWLAPFDADDAHALFEQRMTIVLSGHEHSSTPFGETTSRGQAVYSRTGCLYETHRYRNAFHVLDVDHEHGHVEIAVRAWSSRLRNFDAALDSVPNGSMTFNLPMDRLLPAVRPSFTPVLHALGELAHEVSVVGDRLGDRADATIDDLLVARRFWPLPYAEVTAARELDYETDAEPVDAVAAIADGQVVVVSGDPDSGVTSALLWLLAQHFKRDDERLPAYVRYERGFSKPQRFERAVREAASRLGTPLERGGDLPPSLLAVDDIDVTHTGALNGFSRYIADHPNQRYILGCHENDDAALANALTARDVSCQRVYLGPLVRAEMRELIHKLTGDMSQDLLDKAFNTVISQKLPRSPFVMAALVAVLSQETDVSALNISGLLDAYVKWLLGGEEAADFKGLGMDYRRREHLLGWFASVLLRGNVSRLPRQRAERELLDYFEKKGYINSSAKVIDSLVARRVLVEDGDGVGFRHPAFLALFAGRAMLDDPAFAKYVMQDPFQYPDAVRHAAGLRRSDRDLLVAVDQAAQAVLAAVGDDVRADMFDHVSTRPGWSKEEPTFDQLKAAIEAGEPARLDDEQLDLLYDQVEAAPPNSGEDLPLPPLLDALGRATSLIGSVLRSSELVDDVPLKSEVLKRVLHGWSLLCIVTALREDQTSELRDRLRGIFLDEDADPSDIDRFDRLTELLLVLMMVIFACGAVGSQHLRRVLERVLDDEAFMASSGHALFATMTYCHLGFSGWPDRLTALYDRHRGQPLVGELARTYALMAYLQRRAAGLDEQRLETFLVKTHASAPTGTGATAIVQRGASRSALVAQLRKSRDDAQRMLPTESASSA